jgi:hypothetical protein
MPQSRATAQSGRRDDKFSLADRLLAGFLRKTLQLRLK